MKLNKIFIIGIAGSGKTTLAKKISQILKIDSYDLDKIVFRKKDFERVSDSVRNKRLNKILKNKKWIIEGSYKKDWVIPVVKRSDVIIFLDTSPLTSKKRLVLRFIKRKLKKNTKPESLRDFVNLIKYSNKKVSRGRKDFSEYMAKKHKKGIIILKNKKEINKFLRKLKND